MLEQTVPDVPTEPTQVRRVGGWAVGTSRGEDFAVSRRCRHQLAHLSKGTVDADGCLVCPWHSSRYDVRTGAMVDGPQGLLFYRFERSMRCSSDQPSLSSLVDHELVAGA